MSQTQEYQDCDSIIGLRSSLGVEVGNFHTSLSAISALMAIIDADQPRRSQFDIMYRKIDDSYVASEFDTFVDKVNALKTHLEDEEWVE